MAAKFLKFFFSNFPAIDDDDDSIDCCCCGSPTLCIDGDLEHGCDEFPVTIDDATAAERKTCSNICHFES
ncbi:hypothetical protein DERP_004183 [Dermatophagoides pteronyssinus]|uniref:Uncharacterized protein n=1 Tax=Dermatophagoides pteronyssinus TaxID=6956 RepID=A0ABQ8J901_DERPT|nr:hypothetical protein DERP_004183 [Dermatophagoides pteronyssinus]